MANNGRAGRDLRNKSIGERTFVVFPSQKLPQISIVAQPPSSQHTPPRLSISRHLPSPNTPSHPHPSTLSPFEWTSPRFVNLTDYITPLKHSAGIAPGRPIRTVRQPPKLRQLLGRILVRRRQLSLNHSPERKRMSVSSGINLDSSLLGEGRKGRRVEKEWSPERSKLKRGLTGVAGRKSSVGDSSVFKAIVQGTDRPQQPRSKSSGRNLLERAYMRWWHKQDLPAKGDADYEVLEKHWQGDGSELTVISDSPALFHLVLCSLYLFYLLLVQTSCLSPLHWYPLSLLSLLFSYFFLTAHTDYRILEWENYIVTQVANLAERQRLADLQRTDLQGYYILMRRLLASRFQAGFAYERQGQLLVPVLRLWTPNELIEKLWAVGSPVHVYLAYMNHSAGVLLLVSIGVFAVLARFRESLAVKTVISELAVYQHAAAGGNRLGGMLGGERRSPSPAGRGEVVYKNRFR